MLPIQSLAHAEAFPGNSPLFPSAAKASCPFVQDNANTFFRIVCQCSLLEGLLGHLKAWLTVPTSSPEKLPQKHSATLSVIWLHDSKNIDSKSSKTKKYKLRSNRTWYLID